MNGHRDEIVPSREGLVDGVIDHFVDEVVVRSRRPDVHPGAESDRLKAFEDSDVLCGVGCFCHQKALQIKLLRAAESVSEMAAGAGPSKARSSGSGDELAQLRILDLRGRRRCLRVDCGVTSSGLAGLAGSPSLGGPCPVRGRRGSAASPERQAQRAPAAAPRSPAKGGRARRPTWTSWWRRGAFRHAPPEAAMPLARPPSPRPPARPR